MLAPWYTVSRGILWGMPTPRHTRSAAAFLGADSSRETRRVILRGRLERKILARFYRRIDIDSFGSMPGNRTNRGVYPGQKGRATMPIAVSEKSTFRLRPEGRNGRKNPLDHLRHDDVLLAWSVGETLDFAPDIQDIECSYFTEDGEKRTATARDLALALIQRRKDGEIISSDDAMYRGLMAAKMHLRDVFAKVFGREATFVYPGIRSGGIAPTEGKPGFTFEVTRTA